MTFSLCMIVKNEEKTLERCLESLKAAMDEIIIVDTGSTDKTKEIAAKYTDKIYDFEWIDDFSAARNFAFSKATGDYIYCADADEYLDLQNVKKLLVLKQAMLPEVEIVQMVYITKFENHATENYERDLRPKLYKRVRSFTWIDPIHEIVNLEPVVYDSEIEVIHEPEKDHSKRDFQIFEKTIVKNGYLSKRVLGMYLRELYKAGEEKDICKAQDYLVNVFQENAGSDEKDKEELCRKIIAVLMKYYRQTNNQLEILKLSLEAEANIPSAEICLELGLNFLENKDANESVKWFYQAAFNSECELDIYTKYNALINLSRAYRIFADSDELKKLALAEGKELRQELMLKAKEYEEQALEWKAK